MPSLCPTGQYYDAGTSSCQPCHALCSQCTSASNGNCQACVTDATLTGGSCTCNSGFFFDSSTCVACDVLCGDCTAAGSTNCSSCAPGAALIDGTTECVASCPSGKYESAGVCYPCDAACSTCSSNLPYDCSLCTPGFYDWFSSPSKNPLHCLSSCPSSTFISASTCTGRLTPLT